MAPNQTPNTPPAVNGHQVQPNMVDDKSMKIPTKRRVRCADCTKNLKDPYQLSTSDIKHLMWYLTALMAFGLAGGVTTLRQLPGTDNSNGFQEGLYGAMATSMLGASIYYARKLYKGCKYGDIVLIDQGQDVVRRLGVMFYYFIRPLFAVCFGLLTVLLIKGGISVMSAPPAEGADAAAHVNFVYVVMTLAFFVGFSSPQFIDGLEEKGKGVVDGLLNEERSTNGTSNQGENKPAAETNATPAENKPAEAADANATPDEEKPVAQTDANATPDGNKPVNMPEPVV